VSLRQLLSYLFFLFLSSGPVPVFQPGVCQILAGHVCAVLGLSLFIFVRYELFSSFLPPLKAKTRSLIR